jgi:hypothetical protein
VSFLDNIPASPIWPGKLVSLFVPLDVSTCGYVSSGHEKVILISDGFLL